MHPGIPLGGICTPVHTLGTPPWVHLISPPEHGRTSRTHARSPSAALTRGLSELTVSVNRSYRSSLLPFVVVTVRSSPRRGIRAQDRYVCRKVRKVRKVSECQESEESAEMTVLTLSGKCRNDSFDTFRKTHRRRA